MRSQLRDKVSLSTQPNSDVMLDTWENKDFSHASHIRLGSRQQILKNFSS